MRTTPPPESPVARNLKDLVESYAFAYLEFHLSPMDGDNLTKLRKKMQAAQVALYKAIDALAKEEAANG